MKYVVSAVAGCVVLWISYEFVAPTRAQAKSPAVSLRGPQDGVMKEVDDFYRLATVLRNQYSPDSEVEMLGFFSSKSPDLRDAARGEVARSRLARREFDRVLELTLPLLGEEQAKQPLNMDIWLATEESLVALSRKKDIPNIVRNIVNRPLGNSYTLDRFHNEGLNDEQIIALWRAREALGDRDSKAAEKYIKIAAANYPDCPQVFDTLVSVSALKMESLEEYGPKVLAYYNRASEGMRAKIQRDCPECLPGYYGGSIEVKP